MKYKHMKMETIDEIYDIRPKCYFCGIKNKINKIYICVNVSKQTINQQKKRVICKSCGLNIYGNIIL